MLAASTDLSAAYDTVEHKILLMKLDYCNALLYNLNNNEINMLQAVQIEYISSGYQLDKVNAYEKKIHFFEMKFSTAFCWPSTATETSVKFYNYYVINLH